MMPPAIRSGRLAGLVAFVLAAGLVGAEVQPEQVGRAVPLPARPGPHWFWLSDMMLHRTALFDADSGSLLGTITAGSPGVGFVVSPLVAPDRREIYVAESYYARGIRGARTDVVTVYDGATLKPLAEIGIPPKRAEYFPGNAANALSDDGRFAAVFNLTPATSLSIVDVRERRFTAEVPSPGCALAYAAGPRRFFMLCGNGALLTVTVDDAGQPAPASRGEPFFDPATDPITEKGVRRGNQWLFVSYEGMVHPIDVAGPAIQPGEKWALFDDADRKDRWRVGGPQHLAVHGPTGRLYVLVHQGAPDTHKDPGTEVWVFDLGTKKRVQRIPMLNPIASFVGQLMGLAENGRTGGLRAWMLNRALPHTGVERILVTQDENPVLVASASMPPTLTIHDAMSGAVVREISEPGIAATLLFNHP
jgi:methylamine dehydrogenase heavy chain